MFELSQFLSQNLIFQLSSERVTTTEAEGQAPTALAGWKTDSPSAAGDIAAANASPGQIAVALSGHLYSLNPSESFQCLITAL